MSSLRRQNKHTAVPLAPYLMLIAFLIFMSGYGLMEVLGELREVRQGTEEYAVAFAEIAIVAFSVLMLVYLSYMLYQKHSEQKHLERSLELARKQLESSNQLLQKGKQDFRNVIEWQFNEWSLTPSEKQVALLLLNGLSIKEIADKRNTHEKTVRKHASAVYEKSGLSGRHLLSAWFFEDLL